MPLASPTAFSHRVERDFMEWEALTMERRELLDLIRELAVQPMPLPDDCDAFEALSCGGGRSPAVGDRGGGHPNDRGDQVARRCG